MINLASMILLVILLQFTVFWYSIEFAYADQAGLGLQTQTINPGSFYYPFKRAWEKILVNFQISPKNRANFYENLVQIRLSELKYVVEKNYLDQIERSSQRLSYQVGILTDYIKDQKLNEKEHIMILYNQDKLILERLRDKYPANSSFWMLIQHVINSTNLNLEKFEK